MIKFYKNDFMMRLVKNKLVKFWKRMFVVNLGYKRLMKEGYYIIRMRKFSNKKIYNKTIY